VRLVLASQSPRRADLLRLAGYRFDIQPAHVDEAVRSGEPPDAFVQRLAREKAAAIACLRPDDAVIGADTVVVVNHVVLGKPNDAVHAQDMLRRLSGRTHEVWTGVAVSLAGRIEAEVSRTVVQFTHLTEEELAWYVASGEPFDKAGAYGVQGLASRFVERIEGSYSNVVGLPVTVVARLLRAVAPDGAFDDPRPGPDLASSIV
jgi:septum formation protein